ncbi:MAG: 6-carboxy-5,6,7,8-tetrahydropterin synthase [Candidatus Heimdallarchaeota archaeon LC_2]|nr:MAG: 6-carboxy-5,6,7,8-tetrahydropterin synthase [Candidatus Heimdallarchaeota archaeon LC_2]
MDNQNLVTIYKVKEISIAHKLSLPYKSKCNKMHGHNFKIEIWVKGKVTSTGMVIDFNKLKDEVMKYDHTYLNDLIEIPTAENLAIKLCNEIYSLSEKTFSSVKIRVWETTSAYAETRIEK